MAAPFPGAAVSFASIGSPASSHARSGRGRAPPALLLLGRGRGIDPLIEGLAQIPRQRIIGLARIPPVSAVISAASRPRISPSLSVVQTEPSRAQEGCARALLAAEAERAVNQPVDEPFEAHRHLDELAPQLCGHAVDHGAGDHRLAHGRCPRATPAGSQTDRRSPRRDNGWDSSARPMGVTMPWRSASVSLAKAMSNLSRRPISRAMA